MSADIHELEIPVTTARQVAMCLDRVTSDKWSQACIIVAIFENLPAEIQASVVLKLNSLYNEE